MKSYSISELSQEFDVTTRTLRFYEEKGLLAPTRKGQSRIYAARDRARLKLNAGGEPRHHSYVRLHQYEQKADASLDKEDS